MVVNAILFGEFLRGISIDLPIVNQIDLVPDENLGSVLLLQYFVNALNPSSTILK